MSYGTQSDYGREKGNDTRRRVAPLYDGANPPGSHAEGLVNLMRENHWSANPAADHDRGLNSLITRTADDLGKFGPPAAKRTPAGEYRLSAAHLVFSDPKKLWGRT